MFATPKELVAFRKPEGQVPFEEWLDELKDKEATARILPGWRACGWAIWVIASRLAKA